MFKSHLQNLEFMLDTIKKAHAKKEEIRFNEFYEIVGIEPWHEISTTMKPEDNETLDDFRERVIMRLPAMDAKELFYYMSDEKIVRYAYLTKQAVYLSEGKVLKAPRDIDAAFEPKENESFEDFKFRVFDKVNCYQ